MTKKIKFLLSCSFLILLTGLFSNAWSQEIALKEGVYTSFYSFVNQMPMVEMSIQVKDFDSYKRKLIRGSNIKILSSLKLKKKELKNIKKMMWGFYDGQNLYINSNNYHGNSLQSTTNLTYGNSSPMPFISPMPFTGLQIRNKKNNKILFNKVEYLGLRYSYFESISELTEETNLAAIAENLSIIKNYFVINMETGKIFPMNKQTVEELLEEDQELWKKFLEDKKNKGNQLYYIQEFNKRNSY